MTVVNWRPYTNPLPKPNNRYFITVKTKSKSTVIISAFMRSSHFSYAGNWPNGTMNSAFSFLLPMTYEMSSATKIVAWAPLLKPYRKDSPSSEWHDYQKEKPQTDGWFLVTIGEGRRAHVCQKIFNTEVGKFMIRKSKSQNGIVAWAELPKPFEETIEEN